MNERHYQKYVTVQPADSISHSQDDIFYLSLITPLESLMFVVLDVNRLEDVGSDAFLISGATISGAGRMLFGQMKIPDL